MIGHVAVVIPALRSSMQPIDLGPRLSRVQRVVRALVTGIRLLATRPGRRRSRRSPSAWGPSRSRPTARSGGGRRCGGRTRGGGSPPATCRAATLAGRDHLVPRRSSRARAGRRSPAPRRSVAMYAVSCASSGPCVRLREELRPPLGRRLSIGSASDTRTSTISPVDVVIGPPRYEIATRARLFESTCAVASSSRVKARREVGATGSAPPAPAAARAATRSAHERKAARRRRSGAPPGPYSRRSVNPA